MCLGGIYDCMGKIVRAKIALGENNSLCRTYTQVLMQVAFEQFLNYPGKGIYLGFCVTISQNI